MATKAINTIVTNASGAVMSFGFLGNNGVNDLANAGTSEQEGNLPDDLPMNQADAFKAALTAGDITVYYRMNAPLQLDNDTGAWNSALLMGGGTSGDPVTTATANKKFLEFRCQTTATSGDNRLLYMRYAIDGGGGGECLRAFSVLGASTGTAHGAHLSLITGLLGAITGLGAASRSTLHLGNQALAAGGTYAAIMPEIWSDGTTTDPSAVTEMSFIRCVLGGNATGLARVDDKAFLLTLAGGAVASGNVMAAKTASAVSHGLRMKGPNGTTYYIMVSDAQ